MNQAKAIKQKAIDLGFDLAGITSAAPLPAEQIAYFRDWLAKANWNMAAPVTR